MSLLDTASLIVTPNGYKAGTLYSVIPNTTLGDLDVTRATTASRVKSSVLIESVACNVPRFDYSNGSCPSILVEPQRTNRVLYSSSFDNIAWEKGSVATVTANTTVSPDGTTNADTVTCNGLGLLFTRQVAYLGTTQKCSNSIFAKKGNTRYFAFRNYGDLGGLYDVFDFDTKTWTQNSSAVLSYEELDNGWFRLTSVNSDTLGNYYISFFPTENTGGTEFDSITNKFVYVWGAQAEIASYATSYIPTTSASVTRNADVISKTGISSLIGQTEGTVFLDVKNTFQDATFLLQLDDATGLNRIILVTSGGTQAEYYVIKAGNVEATAVGGTLPNKGHIKIAVAYKNNDFAFYANGQQINLDTSGLVPAMSVLRIGENSDGAGNKGANYDTVALWKTRLTNTQLAQLTTI
jgi:hypothetical protein